MSSPGRGRREVVRSFASQVHLYPKGRKRMTASRRFLAGGVLAGAVCILGPVWAVWGTSFKNSGDGFVLALPVMLTVAVVGLTVLALREVRRG